MKTKSLYFEIDLNKIVGEGDFPCPKCRTIISPEDWSGDVYEIIDTKVKNDEIDELIILCNKCKSKIRLFGWS